MDEGLTVITLSRDNPAFFGRCAVALEASRHGAGAPERVDKVLVQHGRDAETEAIATELGWRIAKPGRNGSYARGNNLGAADATTSHLLLLNNDAILDTAALGALWACRRERIVGSLIVNDQRIVTHAGGTFKVGDDGRQWPQHSGRGTGTPDDFPHDLRCYWVTFACVLLDTELWRALDGLREDFWYGYEDVDFCLRARPHGTHPIVAHGAVVEHGEFGTRTGVEDRQNQETFADLWPAAELDATLAGGL